jgi:hypothetical protein
MIKIALQDAEMMVYVLYEVGKWGIGDDDGSISQ